MLSFCAPLLLQVAAVVVEQNIIAVILVKFATAGSMYVCVGVCKYG